jgi:NADH-quinone oxidoreductase subunit D
MELQLRDEEFLETGEMILNMGPQHPSTHGVIRFVIKSDGEVISEADPEIGYLHRGLEKIAERVNYHQYMPYTDRLDYLASMNCNIGYAMTVEKLAQIEVPERAEYIRVIMAELNRIASHLIAVGTFGMDMGAVTPFLHALRERERINDLFEMVCGARLTYNYIRIGGVSKDLPDGFIEKTREFLDYFEPKIDQYNRLLSYNKIFVKRLANIAVITKEDAIQYGIVGPNLRGSGIKWDLRKDEPYSLYPKLEFDIPIGYGEKGTLGDCFDRYMVRIREMKESVKIIRQCLDQIPGGEIMTKIPRILKIKEGEVYLRTEAPRGELGFYLISDGSQYPYRLKLRTGSFSAMSIIKKISKGCMIADLVAIIGSLDIIAPEIDR